VFVYVSKIEPYVHLSVFFPFYDENLGQCAVEGVEEEEEFVAVYFTGVLEPEYIHDCFEVGLVRPF
jgi:hypothetical protein